MGGESSKPTPRVAQFHSARDQYMGEDQANLWQRWSEPQQQSWFLKYGYAPASLLSAPASEVLPELRRQLPLLEDTWRTSLQPKLLREVKDSALVQRISSAHAAYLQAIRDGNVERAANQLGLWEEAMDAATLDLGPGLGAPDQYMHGENGTGLYGRWNEAQQRRWLDRYGAAPILYAGSAGASQRIYDALPAMKENWQKELKPTLKNIERHYEAFLSAVDHKNLADAGEHLGELLESWDFMCKKWCFERD